MSRRNVLEVLLGHVDLLADGIGKGGAQEEQRLLSQLRGSEVAIRTLGRIGCSEAGRRLREMAFRDASRVRRSPMTAIPGLWPSTGPRGADSGCDFKQTCDFPD